MNEKTCSVTVTTTDNKELVMKCTPSYLEEVKIVLNELRPSMQGSITDGVVRLWKLGRSDKGILPTPDAVDKLIGILEIAASGNGILDIVWDDMIDLKVEYPPTIPKFIFLGDNLIINTVDLKSIFLCEEE